MLKVSVKHKGEKLLNILGTGCFFVKSTRHFETESSPGNTFSFLFPNHIYNFFFLPTFIIWTQVNLILTVKPTLLYLLSWLLFSKLFPLQTQFTMLKQLWSFHPLHWNRAVRYHPFCRSEHWYYNMNKKCASHLFTFLPLQKNETLVNEGLRYQSKEDGPFP